MTLRELFDTAEIRATRRSVEAAVLARQVTGGHGERHELAIERLRIAAIASFTDTFGNWTVEEWLRHSWTDQGADCAAACECFEDFRGYLEAVEETADAPDLDDLLFFAVSGFVARKPHEVRDFLRRETARKWVDARTNNLKAEDWVHRVRAHVSLAIILLIRQNNRSDIESSSVVLRELGRFQRTFEAQWLEEQTSQRRDALTLLSFYHLAQGVLRTSEFLLAGSVKVEERLVNDVLAELRRLLVRAEEFASLAGNLEVGLWLVASAIALASLRESSIWVQSRGISQRIDGLLDEMTREGRSQQVFSLLPSQQDALREAFLDRTRLAVVLQMPTSAGKTLLAEFAIAQTFDAYRDQTRVAYVVPTRALATQIRRNLAEDLGPIGLKVSAAGSAFEEDPYELQLLAGQDGVVVTTPEKLDLMLRVHPSWFDTLRLVVVDEAHLLHDGERGARLELLLANLRREQPDARLLLLTPFMDNAKQIAAWLSPERGHPVQVSWRPSRVLLGISKVDGRRGDWKLRINWTDPYSNAEQPEPLCIDVGATKEAITTNLSRVLFIGRRMQPLGTVLALFSASPAHAESAAWHYAEQMPVVPVEEQSTQLRLAAALARYEFGSESQLANCLERGVAFHHSSLSPILRYLIEDQIRSKTIKFVAATSTLAQGMNFPVATVLVHSVHKPRGRGNLSASEFWNIAGRAGRVGMTERGLVVFSDPKHVEHLNRYTRELKSVLVSAMLAVIPQLRIDQPIKDQYRDFPALRPFIQYLAHAAARSTPARALENLEELIQQSLANQQVRTPEEARKLRGIARRYIQEIFGQQGGMLKAADQTGLATFSFGELYAKLRGDPLLTAGPQHVLAQGEEGLYKLVDALKWLPELDLAIGFGEGSMDVRAVAQVVNGWVAGRQVHELAGLFPGDDFGEQCRKAAQYVYGTVSQALSWGAHAYLRGWLMTSQGASDSRPEHRMLPSYIQYGVHSPEAAVASLLGVPRPFAEAIGQNFREERGELTPETAAVFQEYVESASETTWAEVAERAGVRGVQAKDLRIVFRQMQGIPDKR